jgi:hypothetical protein
MTTREAELLGQADQEAKELVGANARVTVDR